MDPCYCVKCNAQFDKFKAEVEKLKANNDLLCKVVNDQQKRRWEMKQDKIIVEEERDKLMAENRELKLEAIAAEAVKYHPEEDGHTREAKLREALEKVREHEQSWLEHGSYDGKEDGTVELLKDIDKALKGDK